MESISLPSGEGFAEYYTRIFERFLNGDLFPFSLKETFSLVYSSLDEAEEELLANGVEGFSYVKSPAGDDYLMCPEGFTLHIVMKDKSLELLPLYCNTMYKRLMTIFDIPVHYESRCVKGDDGRMKIVQEPINGYQPKKNDPLHCGLMEATGDLFAKMSFEQFQQDAGFTNSTAEIAEKFGMPEEGLLCILKQNGIIVDGDEDEDEGFSWKLSENYRHRGFTLVKTVLDGKPEIQWTHAGVYYIWLHLTKDCGIRPCCERSSDDVR